MAHQACARIAELLEVPTDMALNPDEFGPDAVVTAGSWTFELSCKRPGSLAAVASALRALDHDIARPRTVIPLVVVPYMGQAAGEHCRNAKVSWLDLSGNAHIIGPGLRIIIEGRPNQFAQRGRPANPFAPMSSRVARWFLMHNEAITQRELARATNLDEGHTSRIVGRLVADGLLERQQSGQLRAPDPDLLLDAWAERYDFHAHEICKGHVAARTGVELTHRLSRDFDALGLRHAFTGLAAAWQWTSFAHYRLTTVFLPEGVYPEIFDRLRGRADERGANVWLIMPNDAGVMSGVTAVDEIQCVHPVQAWLDLRAHPERAPEAAAQLRLEAMNRHG